MTRRLALAGAPSKDRLGMPLTPQQWRVLRLYALHGSYKIVADTLGVAPATVGTTMNSAYHRLGVSGAWEAYTLLGWLQVPPTEATR